MNKLPPAPPIPEKPKPRTIEERFGLDFPIKIKPRWTMRFNHGKWTKERMCKRCGTLLRTFQCNTCICSGCGNEIGISECEYVVIKWIGIPHTPFGYYITK